VGLSEERDLVKSMLSLFGGFVARERMSEKERESESDIVRNLKILFYMQRKEIHLHFFL
jgi:hypothetical protein